MCTELRRRGYHAINGDTELAYQGDPETGAPTDGHSHEHHIWRVETVKALVANGDDSVTFFCGGSRNFPAFIDLFDGVFVLNVDVDTLVQRLDERPDDEFGASPAERELILRLDRTREDTPNGIVIDATQPVAVVVDDIIAQTKALLRVGDELPVGLEGRSNIEVTVAAYEQSVEAYVAASPATPPAAYLSFRDGVLDLLPPHARMLELGSGPGHDAEFFTSKGVEVLCTDAAHGFVDRLRMSGYRAEVLDVTIDAFGGPFDVVFANAVLLHLTPVQFGKALVKAAHAVTSNGLLAFTVKQGEGDAWSTAKLDQPRYFRYWQPADIQNQLAQAGWAPLRIDCVQGRVEPWLYVICRRRA